MNERDKTAQMMQDSSGQHWGTEAHFQRFAALIRADEREACEALCKWRTGIQQVDAAIDTCAAAIRARENT